MKTAIQLYTLRNRLSEGVEKVLKEIREMGYEGVEWYYLPDNSPEKAAELSKAAGLEIFSAHIDINIVLAGDRELLKRLAKAGFKYLPIGWLPQERLAGGPLFAETCDAIRTYAEMAKEEGLYVMYHNHDFEFEKTTEGEYVLDLMYRVVGPEYLQTQIDTCWVNVGGENPADYLKKYAGRTPTVHLKDFAGSRSENMYALIGIDEDKKKEASGQFQFRPVGKGLQNFPAIIAAADECGAEWYIVEQDSPSMGKTPMESVQMSIEYLKGIL